MSAVSTFPEEGRQPAADHAAEEETLQKPNHPGLQDVSGGSDQHGGGEAASLVSSSSNAVVLLSLRAGVCVMLLTVTDVAISVCVLCYTRLQMTQAHHTCR